MYLSDIEDFEDFEEQIEEPCEQELSRYYIKCGAQKYINISVTHKSCPRSIAQPYTWRHTIADCYYSFVTHPGVAFLNLMCRMGIGRRY
ncbi:hypothetical protein DSO57_1029008 [Entomophthora muscae]|uniref:Uncharacterized protein n=1 Tax=Entomophthora muscae TaxID=34485 RepID=A0ACC2UB22_9FUNG|nr:hypothetical protein DSO57_1029008 [Entomophthora muscae]